MFELKQEREQTVVLVHAAVRDDYIQRPVHLGEDMKVKTHKRKGVTSMCEESKRKAEQKSRQTGKGRVIDEGRRKV